MPFSTSIQQLSGAQVLGTGKLAVDWGRDRAWNLGSTGISRIDILSGDQDDFGLYTSYGDGTTWIFMGNIFGVGTDANGNVYTAGQQLNNGGIVQVDGSTLALLEAHAYPMLYDGGANYANVVTGGSQYMINATAGGSFVFQQRVNIDKDGVPFDNASWPGATASASAVVGAGGPGTDYGYIIVSSNTAPQQAVVNKVVVATPTSTTINTLVPSDIDASWTTVVVKGMCTDQMDGNPMLYAEGTGSAVAAYVVKIDKDTGTVIWTAALPGAAGITGMWNQSIVEHSRLYVLTSSPNTVTTIDTTDGSSSAYTAGLAGIIAFGTGLASSDNAGAIVLNCEFNETAGSPARLNSTPSSFLQDWAVLYVAYPPTPPVSSGRKWMALLGPVRAMTLGPGGVRGAVDLEIEVAGVPGSALGAAGAVSLDIAVAGAVGSSSHGTVSLDIAVAGVIGGAGGGLLKTLQVENFGVADTAGNSHTPMFGLLFKEGDLPAGQWPVLKTAAGTVVPYSAGGKGSWAGGGKFLSMLARFPDAISAGGSSGLRVYAGGSAPTPSARTLAEVYAQNITILGNGGLDNISGDWTCALQAVNVLEAVIWADGPAGKVWRILANFNRLGAIHGQLVTYFYLQSLQDAAGNLASIRVLPRVTQPKYNYDSPPKNWRSFTSLQLRYGPGATIYDSMTNSYSAQSFTWSNSGDGGDRCRAVANGYNGGVGVRLTSTGTLPTGLSTGTTYWFAQDNNSADDFYFADGSAVGALNNGINRIHVTGAGTGVHTMTPIPYLSHFGTYWTATPEGKYVYLAVGSVPTEATLRIRADVVYDHGTKCLPPYDLSLLGTVVSNASYSWKPYSAGPLALFIGQTGEREDIGVLSSFHARHYFTQAAVDERLARIIGLSQGLLPLCFRDSGTLNIANLSAGAYAGMPASGAMTLQWRPSSGASAGFTPPLNPKVWTQCFGAPDPSHQTSYSAYPYIVTGEQQYYDLAMEALNESNLFAPTFDRNFTIGGVDYIGIAPAAKDNVRTGAWAYRDIVWAAVISPDSNPDGSASSAYVRDLAARQSQYLVAFNATNSSWWLSTGYWLPQNCDGGRTSWMQSYLGNTTLLHANGMRDGNALAMAGHFSKWPPFVKNLTGNLWCLGSYRERSGANAGSTGAPVISSDVQWGPFGGPVGLSWTNAGDLFTWNNPNFTPADDDKLIFWNSEVPGGLVLTTPYWAVGVSGNDSQLSASIGGAAVAVLSDGSLGDTLNVAIIPKNPPATFYSGENYAGSSGIGADQFALVKWSLAAGLTTTGLAACETELATRQSGVDYSLDPKNAIQTTY